MVKHLEHLGLLAVLERLVNLEVNYLERLEHQLLLFDPFVLEVKHLEHPDYLVVLERLVNLVVKHPVLLEHQLLLFDL